MLCVIGCIDWDCLYEVNIYGPHNACQRLIFSNVLQALIKVSLVQRCDFNGDPCNTLQFDFNGWDWKLELWTLREYRKLRLFESDLRWCVEHYLRTTNKLVKKKSIHWSDTFISPRIGLRGCICNYSIND